MNDPRLRFTGAGLATLSAATLKPPLCGPGVHQTLRPVSCEEHSKQMLDPTEARTQGFPAELLPEHHRPPPLPQVDCTTQTGDSTSGFVQVKLLILFKT